MRFRFLAVDSHGEHVQGEIIAESKISAEQQLNKKNLHVKFLQSYKTPQTKPKTFLEKLRNRFSLARETKEWKFRFFEELSILLGACLPLDHCLMILSDDGESNTRGSIAILRDKIHGGLSLSEAMTCCDGIFSEIEIKTIRAAEQIGQPAVALQKLSDYGRQLRTIKRKLQAALIYPMIVLTAGCGALILFMTMIVPRLEVMLTSDRATQQLPWLTQKVINCCRFFGNNWLLILFAVIVLLLFSSLVFIRKRVRKFLHKIFSKLPLFRQTCLDFNLNNFFRTLSMLMSFGLSLQESLKISLNVVADAELIAFLRKLLNKINHGEKLSEVFRRGSFIGVVERGLLLAGEQSGNLTQSLGKISYNYNEKLVSRITVLSNLIEPVIIILLSIVVGVIVIAMFLPMIGLMQNIKL